MENTKAKKVGIIVVVALIVVCMGILATVLLNNNNAKENNQGNSTNNEIANKQEINVKKFGFIYDIDAIDEKWWNSINETENWKGLDYTNEQVFEAGWKNNIGNTVGKLKVRPVDFVYTMEVSEKQKTTKKVYYDFEINENKFLIPQELSKFSENNFTNELNFYTLGNDAGLYKIKFKIDERPTDLELQQGEWKTTTKEEKGRIKVESYYYINEKLCLQINYPNQIVGTKEQIKQDVLLDLAEKVTGVITIKSAEKKDVLSYNIELEDVKIDESVSILLKNMKITNWNSGDPDVVAARVLSQYSTSIQTYNSTGDEVAIYEYRNDLDKEQIEKAYNSETVELEEYTYKGKQIYLKKYNEEAYDNLKNKYLGIFFEADGMYYSVSYVMSVLKSTKLNKGEVDSWIEKLCEGVVEFK